VFVAALLVVSLIPQPAFGSVSDIPSPLGEFVTNPHGWVDWNNPDLNWRQGWGNSTTVKYLLNLPAMDEYDHSREGNIRHVHYRFDRSLLVRDVIPGGERVDMSTVFPADGVVDIQKDLVSHWYLEPESAWGYVPLAAQKHPFEGIWSFAYRFEADGPLGNESVLSSNTIGPITLGIDVTAPLQVRTLTAKPSERYTGPTGPWTASTQAFVFWEDRQYDDLSGTANFEVQVNGETRGKPVFYLPPTKPYVTIHDMPPGTSTIRVRAVDRATNPGPWATTTFRSDPDVPTLKITRPAKDNALIGAFYTFEAEATDLAGIRWVRFSIDGAPVGTVTKPPYRLALDMRKYRNGAHTLTVETQDMLGRIVKQTRPFNLDKIIPHIRDVRDAPDPFYPIIREGYKDNMTVHMNLTKDVHVMLFVYNSDGELVATRQGRRAAGNANISWNGAHDADGSTSTGTYSYRLRVNDWAGNVTWSGRGHTTIRDYEIVRVAPNAVRVIPR